MKRTADNLFFWQNIFRSVMITFLVGLLETLALAQSLSYLSGIRNSSGSHRLSDKQLQQVRENLIRKSGFVEMSFDEQGKLKLGNRQHIVGGSATARLLLIAAVDNANSYELESHDHSNDVAFARIYEYQDRVFDNTGKLTTAYKVQVDFADFDQLSGANEAKATFDLGIALLHELTHGVLKLQDTLDASQIGECDAHVNQIRRELRLPERLYYQPNITVIRTGTGKRIVIAQLEFVEQSAGQNTRYKLGWFPAKVSPNANNIAQLEQGLVKAHSH